LNNANLLGADLSEANLARASLRWANLRNADLTAANLSFARLLQTDLNGALLSYANLLRTEYAPATAPAPGYLVGLQGLTTVHFPPGEDSGLAQLRTRLAETGLRDLERRATYALEHQTTLHKLQEWEDRPFSGVEGIFRLVFFEWPVAYGLYPGRALQLLLGFILAFSVPYMVALVNPLTRHAGIWRVWATDRVVKLRGQDEPERLEDDWYGDPWWRALYCVPLRALQFSILSAFHLGFRELNVGTWLARVQAHEYTLRATGWVRVVAGLQSLLSIYLLALWALTYFGRPFQ
jgi:hypothetical protein